MQMSPDDMLRAARRSSDLSQRQLAARAGVPHSSVGRIESGRAQPTVALMVRLLDAAGCDLVVVRRADGSQPAAVHDGPLRDRGRRRYPAHLDIRVFPGYRHGLRPPRRPVPACYFRDRAMRDRFRWAGHVDVRVVPVPEELYGHAPPAAGPAAGLDPWAITRRRPRPRAD